MDLQDQITLEQRRLAQKEQKLHGLTLELAVIEERERRQLAAELHDYLAQLLTLARLKVKQGRQGLYISPPLSDQHLGQADEFLAKSLEYVRTLMAELYPECIWAKRAYQQRYVGSPDRCHGMDWK